MATLTARFKNTVALATGMLIAATRHANVACGGTVGMLGVYDSGNVFVSYQGSYGTSPHVICNLYTQGGFGATVNTCKAWYSYLLAAKLSNQNVWSDYTIPASCSAIAAWSYQTTTYTVRQ